MKICASVCKICEKYCLIHRRKCFLVICYNPGCINKNKDNFYYYSISRYEF